MLTHELLRHLGRGGAYGYYHTLPERRSVWYATDTPPDVPEGGTNWYFGVHPCAAIPPCNAHGEIRPPQFVRAQRAFIAALNCLYAEFDVKDYGSKAAIRDHMAGLPIAAPTVLIDSGGGLHAYWLLREPFLFDTDDRREAGRLIQQLWVATVGGDPAVHDLTRVLRVPGTHNYKYDPAPEVSWVAFNFRRQFALRELTAHLPPVRETPPRLPFAQTKSTSIQDYNAQTEVGALLERYGYRWRGQRRMISPHSGSGRDGVSIDVQSNRAFVHTGGDPLCDGYWKRPFDVLLALEYAGDIKRAVKAIRS